MYRRFRRLLAGSAATERRSARRGRDERRRHRPAGSDGVLLGLSSGALVLMLATGGGLMAVGRRSER